MQAGKYCILSEEYGRKRSKGGTIAVVKQRQKGQEREVRSVGI